MKELQPINQNVLLELTEDSSEQKTASGIIIPDSAKEQQSVAKVVAVSNIENAEVVPGDHVLYKKFSGTEDRLRWKDLSGTSLCRHPVESCRDRINLMAITQNSIHSA
jgi:chaperonin GroES